MPNNIDSIARKIQRKKHRLEDNVDDAVERSANSMRSSARSRISLQGTTWIGALFDSIRVDQRRWGTYAVGSNLPYAAYIEFGTGLQNIGTKPSEQFKSPTNSPALQAAIFEWVMTKPNFRGERSFGTAFAIANSIAQKGNKPHPFLKPAYTSQKKATVQRVETAIRAALR